MESFMDKNFAFINEGALSGSGLFLTASKLPDVMRYYLQQNPKCFIIKH